ncbi:glycerophosphocholine phosphodiesterase GPCPD1 [Teleopsis dalmanni]|uniref:glycerophosphocholine phosphodiesterase GPCPD1 n=1 Tax=Teleopsis dalmanni TaxID=139649 RepID=UPI0018CD175E|nr:glycerophosphocholine phosphodiesterase GPCPD1 [Teleopsis dalmanni]
MSGPLSIAEMDELENRESARNYLCMPLLRVFKVKFDKALKGDEHVAVVGDHKTLGEWRIEKSLKLKTRNRIRWYLKKYICANERMHYRYFVYKTNKNGKKRVIAWEGQQHARVLEYYQIFSQADGDKFGEVYGVVETERGWLRHEYVIQFQFIWARHIKFNKNAKMKRLRQFVLKLNVLNENGRFLHSRHAKAEIEVVKYAYKNAEFTKQPSNGIAFIEGADVAIFRVTETIETSSTYELILKTLDGVPIGSARITLEDIHRFEGVLNLPIHTISDGHQIGVLKLPYLLLAPLPNATELTMRSSFHHYWPRNWPIMDVGNRGIGKSFFHFNAPVMENTLRSFIYAYELKADMAKLEIYSTKDYMPVVWNSFGFYTAADNAVIESLYDLEYVLLSELNFAELRERRVFIPKDTYIYEYTDLLNETIENKIFLTLAELYQNLPQDLGLIIELQWPQALQNDECDFIQNLNKNHFIDVTLQLTTYFGCGRALIFTSMDANICAMLRYKQTAFPVMFMTTGESTLWPSFKDLRTRTFFDAINLAQSENLLGTAPHADNFVGGHVDIKSGFALRQVVFLWGDCLNSTENLETYRTLHATGLIYDRIDLNGPKRKRANFFAASELNEIFKRQCISMGRISSER